MYKGTNHGFSHSGGLSYIWNNHIKKISVFGNYIITFGKDCTLVYMVELQIKFS